MSHTSPLQLEICVPQKLIAIRNDECSNRELGLREAETYEVSSDFDFKYLDEEQSEIYVLLKLQCRPRDIDRGRFAEVTVSLFGKFDLSPDVPEELRKQLVPYNCLAILHGIARGLVMSATGTFAGGPFLLPVFNYRAMVDEKLEAMEKE